MDKFSYDYMYWLGHHEFGMTHKPFRFGKEICPPLTDYTTNDINYWLIIWLNTYNYLFENVPKDSVFVCFEDLCESPADTLKYLFESANLLLDKNSIGETFKIPPKKDAEGIDENIINQAQDIYKDLRIPRYITKLIVKT